VTESMNEAISDNREIIRVEQLNKRFGGVNALSDLSLSIDGGEIHALVGENGAGKSTLMKILAGIYQPDSGTVLIKGREAHISSPLAARKYGISIVNQELALFPQLSIAANIFVNREETRGRWVLDKGAMRKETEAVLEQMGVWLDPGRKVRSLPVGEKQIVEIARTLQQNSQIIIMDEPNSALNANESERLFEVLRRLREQGITIIYVSHRLEEVFSISDRISVIRDGKYQGTWKIPETTIPKIISVMIGRDLEEAFPDRHEDFGEAPEMLTAEGLATAHGLNGVDFSVRAGEIVGFAGLEGSGIDEIFDVLFGLESPSGGTIRYQSGSERPKTPFAAIKKGLGMVPANRREEGLMLPWSIRRNTSLAVLDRLLLALGVIDRKNERALAGDYVRRLNVATDSIDKRVVNLSGGNQQKVVLAKWLATGPTVLILNDPTRGVDVGAKAEIYALCDELARSGLALLFTSSEVEEIVGVCDRILVLYRGRVIKEFNRGEADKEAVTFWVSGGKAVLSDEDLGAVA
jgi:ABC-type sugar transport system ATPase subunit